MNRMSKVLCLIGSSLLIIMALFHGSGFHYIDNLVQTSNSSELIKNIFPVLFILPTIQLIGLAVFGLVAAFTKSQANHILIPLSVLILIDAILAFYLHAVLPGGMLVSASLIFILVVFRNRGMD